MKILRIQKASKIKQIDYFVKSGIISFENIQFATDEHSMICVFNILSMSTVNIC